MMRFSYHLCQFLSYLLWSTTISITTRISTTTTISGIHAFSLQPLPARRTTTTETITTTAAKPKAAAVRTLFFPVSTWHSANKRSLFVSSCSVSFSWRLFGIINADDVDLNVDKGLGGVRLAEESAIELVGTVDFSKTKKGGNKSSSGGDAPEANVKDLLRYTAVTELTASTVLDGLEKVGKGANVLCKGLGKELYADPGETTQAKVTYAPDDAVRNAFMDLEISATDIPSNYRLVVNVLGGDDLQTLESLSAIRECVQNVMKIVGSPPSVATFHSLCHSSFPKEQASVTVLVFPSEPTTNEEKGMEQAIANGNIHFRDGKYWTVLEENINLAIE